MKKIVSNNTLPVVKQYEIWLGDLPAPKGEHVQSGHRPLLIISNDTANEHSPVTLSSFS